MKSISAEELDRIFDDGEEDILQYADWSKARRLGDDRQYVSVSIPGKLLAAVDAAADNEGTDRQSIIERWLSEASRPWAA